MQGRQQGAANIPEGVPANGHGKIVRRKAKARMAKKVRRYHLKRTVVIGVFWEDERWAPRALKPAGWRARIVNGGPRKLMHMTYDAHSRAAAFWGFI